MGWTKRTDAVLAHVRRMSTIRALVRDAAFGRIDLDKKRNRRLMWSYLDEYTNTAFALARGSRDGTVRTELGIHINSEPVDVGPLVEMLLEYADSFNFLVTRRAVRL